MNICSATPRTDEPPTPSSSHSFASRCQLNGIDGRRIDFPEVYSGKTGLDLPLIQLQPFDPHVVAAYSGPDGGLTQVWCLPNKLKLQVGECRRQAMARMANLDDEMSLSCDGSEDLDDEETENSVCSESYDWTRLDERRAFGVSTSLYEKNPLTGMRAGEPIADVWGVIARRNNAILALADGVNWGEGARLAARCAIRGAIDHLNSRIIESNFKTSTEVFHELLASFHAAHALILQEGGALTTLCVAVVAPVRNAASWLLAVCNVGDSLCFVYNRGYGVTLNSHDVDQMRDMRDAGGALGPVDGRNPQLHNLTCSMTFVDPGDVVFITSDGISDNFDPVVGKFCVIRKTAEENNKENGLPPRSTDTRSIAVSVKEGGEFGRPRTCAASLPCVDAQQRHELMLLRMRDVVANGLQSPLPLPSPNEPLFFPQVSASLLCHNLVQFSTQLSMAKRRTLENPELYKNAKISKSEQRQRRKMVKERVAEMAGKLDHASVVAYTVGYAHDAPIATALFKERVQEDESDNRELQSVEVSCRASFSRHSHIDKASCAITLPMFGKVRARARKEVNPNAELDPIADLLTSTPTTPMKTPTEHPPRATSPYEQLPVTLCDRELIPEEKRRKKHARGSTGRHTLSVDVRWLKKLVTGKEASREREGSISDRRPDLPSPSGSSGPTCSNSRDVDESNSTERLTLKQRLRDFLVPRASPRPEVLPPGQSSLSRGTSRGPVGLPPRPLTAGAPRHGSERQIHSVRPPQSLSFRSTHSTTRI